MHQQRNHNLLIFTDRGYEDIKKPYQHWNAEIDRMTPRKLEQEAWEKGVKWGEDPKNLHDAHREYKPLSLPPTFCPLCKGPEGNGNYRVGLSIDKSKVMHVFQRSYPGLGIFAGVTACEHFIEDRCFRKMFDEALNEDLGIEQTRIQLPDDVAAHQRKARRWQIEERIVNYIRTMQQTNQDPDKAIYGDDSRKERFAEKEEIL